MARVSWLDENSELPLIDEHVNKLEHFCDSIADGVITADELEIQQKALVSAMRAVEDLLSDDLHEKVTSLLVELTAYNTMSLLHDLVAERLRLIREDGLRKRS